jgi:hypothetical protein
VKNTIRFHKAHKLEQFLKYWKALFTISFEAKVKSIQKTFLKCQVGKIYGIHIEATTTNVATKEPSVMFQYVIPIYTTKTYRGSRGIDPLILDVFLYGGE